MYAYVQFPFFFFKWKFTVFPLGRFVTFFALRFCLRTDLVFHSQSVSTCVVWVVPFLCCLQAPWLVQQLCLCGYAQRRPRHLTKARVHKRNGDCKRHRWTSIKSVQSQITKSRGAHFLFFFFFLNTKASVTLDVDFQGRNSSNSSRYDCNPVSTAVTHSSVEPLNWQKYAILVKEGAKWQW